MSVNTPRRAMARLERMLLDIGGRVVLFPAECEDAVRIANDGERHEPSEFVVADVPHTRCHHAAGRAWLANPTGLAIITGFALFEDDAWREWSWAVMLASGTMIEFASLKRHYFGYRLSKKQSVAFASDND